MTIAEIIELENRRKSADMYGRIHFIKEGNFYRAHDISAWIIAMMPFSENIKNINIIAKKHKDGYIDAFIGFPLTSLEKYIPNDGSVTFVPISDTMIDVMITPTDDILASDFETIRKAVDDWKQTLPLKAEKPEKRESREVSEVQPRITRISDVFSQVLAFPLESKSPMDAYDFLRQLRKEIAALF
jgi:hypothetical protein